MKFRWSSAGWRVLVPLACLLAKPILKYWPLNVIHYENTLLLVQGHSKSRSLRKGRTGVNKNVTSGRSSKLPFYKWYSFWQAPWLTVITGKGCVYSVNCNNLLMQRLGCFWPFLCLHNQKSSMHYIFTH